MIERYTNPEMGKLWSLQHEFEEILEVEITACEAMAELGEIPQEAAVNIRKKARFDLNRVHEIEKVTNHDIIAFLTNVAEYVGEDSKYIHKGLTSSDVKDTALGIMMRKSADIILDDLHRFHEVLARRAAEFKHTPCIGRTHGIHAEPMTFGLKLLLWMAEVERDIERRFSCIVLYGNGNAFFDAFAYGALVLHTDAVMDDRVAVRIAFSSGILRDKSRNVRIAFFQSRFERRFSVSIAYENAAAVFRKNADCTEVVVFDCSVQRCISVGIDSRVVGAFFQ